MENSFGTTMLAPLNAFKHSRDIARETPSHQEIEMRAEVLWRQWGCPEFRDEEIWLEAEQQLTGRSWDERDWDGNALPEPLFSSDFNSGEVMAELGELFPEPDDKEPTSL
jgi:hypothetical protein